MAESGQSGYANEWDNRCLKQHFRENILLHKYFASLAFLLLNTMSCNTGSGGRGNVPDWGRSFCPCPLAPAKKHTEQLKSMVVIQRRHFCKISHPNTCSRAWPKNSGCLVCQDNRTIQFIFFPSWFHSQSHPTPQRTHVFPSSPFLFRDCLCNGGMDLIF